MSHSNHKLKFTNFIIAGILFVLVVSLLVLLNILIL